MPRATAPRFVCASKGFEDTGSSMQVKGDIRDADFDERYRWRSPISLTGNLTKPCRITTLMPFLSHRLCVRSVAVSAATMILAVSSFCQPAVPESGQKSDPAKPPEPNDKRLFGIIPNYRTFPTLTNYKPITPKEKFKIARDDSFDRGTVVLAAAFAGEGQLTNSSPSFGQGVKGYSRYLGTAYVDLVIGDFMTEAVYPTILHQDPRYFRRGTGSGW